MSPESWVPYSSAVCLRVDEVDEFLTLFCSPKEPFLSPERELDLSPQVHHLALANSQLSLEKAPASPCADAAEQQRPL